MAIGNGKAFTIGELRTMIDGLSDAVECFVFMHDSGFYNTTARKTSELPYVDGGLIIDVDVPCILIDDCGDVEIL